MIDIYIRRYKIDGSYDRTIEVKSNTPQRARDTVIAWTSPHSDGELEEHIQTTHLNIMVRFNGKLISYKDLN